MVVYCMRLRRGVIKYEELIDQCSFGFVFRGNRSPVYSMSYNPAENSVLLCTVSVAQSFNSTFKSLLTVIQFYLLSKILLKQTSLIGAVLPTT